MCFDEFQGVCVVSTPDQNETDFTKCVRLLASKVKADQIQVDRNDKSFSYF